MASKMCQCKFKILPNTKKSCVKIAKDLNIGQIAKFLPNRDTLPATHPAYLASNHFLTIATIFPRAKEIHFDFLSNKEHNLSHSV